MVKLQKTLHVWVITVTPQLCINLRKNPFRGSQNFTFLLHQILPRRSNTSIFSMSQPSPLPKSSDDQTVMYIRVKRNKTTYFLQCLPSETVLQIKEKLEELLDQPVNDQRLTLLPNREILDDSKSLADQKVENDAVVALTLRKDDSEFEEVNIVRANDFYQSRETDAGF
ncbi:hypothetical protein MIMGU_mgv1a015092mg [Erythranthe guttata]|uniref:Ubiquitin-like domain-containing protein n=2 Tax=Erythranthe guttata TaxID=4155 RepID=A0A022R0T2_ERYGU|nr:hypothetical protein MIMGU_mgv1a015092mg [Erythranthe guttata]